jgi:hypothetical protein
MPVRTFCLFLATVLGANGSVTAQSSDSATSKPIGAIQQEAALPAGWIARPDQDGAVKDIRFVSMEPGYHLTLGPATILYRSEDEARGPFHTLATFHQMKKPPHPEGYGLFIGGRDLSGKSQSYTYFLVRGDGTYLIKQRNGQKTSEITQGWKPHPAVKKADAQGKTTNLLEIDAKKDPSKVQFKVNGQTVYTGRPGSMHLTGMVGLRANHNLDLHIEDFAVHR